MKISSLVKTVIAVTSLACCSMTYAGTLSPADADIVSAIHSKFAADNTVANLKVNVTSHEGIVTLSGKINTDVEASKLIEIAESVPGVKDVDAPKLTPKKSENSFKDSEITAKVKGTFVREKLFGDKDVPVMSVNVTTTNGVVYLTGTVDNQAEADNAVKLAKSIHGVKSVNSKVVIKTVTQAGVK
ncbi:MAG: BON domain-containing protein [Gammaproteobacteria bacterium]|nr:BON domain-containing protein [Gammaproteobacteria bacterium]